MLVLTTELGRLFQILTTHAEKEVFVNQKFIIIASDVSPGVEWKMEDEMMLLLHMCC